MSEANPPPVSTPRQAASAPAFQPSGQILLGFLKHPIVSLIAGVLLTLLSVWVTWKEKVPVYLVSRAEMIARPASIASRLSIRWDGNEVENVSLTRVAFWNQGKQYLDKTDFTDTDPFRIVPSEPVRILYAQHVRASRPSLRFDANIDGSVIYLAVHGNDGLEYMAGGEFQIAYTSSKPVEFSVQGRVKGANAEFSRETRDSLSNRTWSGRLEREIRNPLRGCTWDLDVRSLLRGYRRPS